MGLQKTRIDDKGRQCTKCGLYKEWSLFYANPGGARGRNSQCCSCFNKTRKSGQRERNLQNKYGISELEYEEMLKKQDGVCLFCQQPPNGKKLDTDHCHQTGKVRALLCANCNKALGLFKDDPEIILRAYNHLISFSQKPIKEMSCDS